VLSSAVIGLPDEDLGNVVHAIVQTDNSVTDRELTEHVRGKLAPYKVPASFERSAEPLRDDAARSAGPRSEPHACRALIRGREWRVVLLDHPPLTTAGGGPAGPRRAAAGRSSGELGGRHRERPV